MKRQGSKPNIIANDGHLPSAERQLAYLYDDDPRFKPGSSAEYSSAHTLALSLVGTGRKSIIDDFETLVLN